MAAKVISENIEEYLEVLYKFGGKNTFVSTTTLSHELGIAPGSVTQMLKKLEDLGYIDVIGGRRGCSEWVVVGNGNSMCRHSYSRLNSLSRHNLGGVYSSLSEQLTSDNSVRSVEVDDIGLLHRFSKKQCLKILCDLGHSVLFTKAKQVCFPS